MAKLDQLTTVEPMSRLPELAAQIVVGQTRGRVVIDVHRWHEVFPNASCVVSLIDRLVRRCEVVAIEAEFYRLKEAGERSAQKTAARASAGRKASKK